MEKLIILFTIRVFTRNTDEAIKIYNTLFSKESTTNKKQSHNIKGTIPKPLNKKDELVESLSYLKNKKVKSKQDKDSIGIIESVLKNMS